MSARFRIPSLTEIEYVQEDDPCVIRPFSAATVPPLKDEVPHRHDFQTIMWTWTGSSTHLIDNQLITSSPGTIHIIARGQVHLFVAVSSDFTGHFVRFEDDFLPEVSAPAIKNYRQSLFSGRRSGHLLQMEQKEAPAYQTLLAEMEEESHKLGGNGVIGVDLDYEVIGQNGSMLMVSASGTAVQV